MCLTHSYNKDFTLSIHEDSSLYASTIVGPLFSIPVEQAIEWETLPTLEGKHKFAPDVTTTSTGDLNLVGHPMAMQAKMFSDLIKDILVTDSLNAAAVVPSLYALQQCLRSGWQTHHFEKV